MIKQLASLTTVAVATITTLLLASVVVTQAKPNEEQAPNYTDYVYMQGQNYKINICHSTQPNPSQGQGQGPQNNPYTFPGVNLSAVDGQGQNDHTSHTGPIFVPDTNMLQWGDIIPPVYVGDPGYNWTEYGQAIWNNGCQIPDDDKPNNEQVIATASINITDANCVSAAILTYGDEDIFNAVWSGTPSGTAGGDYLVVATADANALFTVATGVSENLKTKTFDGTLDPIVTEGCILGDEEEVTDPEDEEPVAETVSDTPEVLPYTSSETPAAGIAIATAVAGSLILVSQLFGSALSRKL